MKKRNFYFLLISLILVLSILLNIYHFFIEKRVNTVEATGFSFLDPTISNLDLDTFLIVKEQYTSSYAPLKEEVNNIISNSSGHFGVYFEDLEFHSWFGINEREYFTPASLLKITTVAAILKEVEEGELSLDQEVMLSNENLDEKFGDLYKRQGSMFSIKELIEITLIYSDNTAVKSLHPFLLDVRWKEARLSLGLPIISIEESEKGVQLTPKQFSNVFRSLYYSSYLSRSSSNWILSLLSQTPFESGIPAGVPDDIRVAHKIGVWVTEGSEVGSVHDCGIIYAKKPYILCIMSDNTTTVEGNRVIKEISETVYNYISNS